METIKIGNKLTMEERETILVYDSVNKVWRMDTTVSKHANRAKKQEWKQITEYVYDDGVVLGGVFEAPDRSVTFRNVAKKQMSEKQLKNLLEDEDD